MRANRFVVVVSGVLLACSAVQVAAQSLADVAKKEEERRKQVADKASGKVYTNKDLGTVPEPSTPAPAAGATGDSAAPTEPAKTADGKPADAKDAGGKDAGDASKKDQAYWSGRMKGAVDAIDRDQTLADAMQSRINALTTDFVNRDDPAQRSVIERDRQRALAELDRLKKQIVADRKAVADIEEEARRAGVPPGWLR